MKNILSIVEDYLECQKLVNDRSENLSVSISKLIEKAKIDFEEQQKQIESYAHSIKLKEDYIQLLRSEVLSKVDTQKPLEYDVEYHARIEADYQYLKRWLKKILGVDSSSSQDLVVALKKVLEDKKPEPETPKEPAKKPQYRKKPA